MYPTCPYYPKELQEEADIINRLISKEKFVKYFWTKDKSTKPSPSGHHMGHYKSMLEDDMLSDLMVAIFIIDLATDTALKHWRRNLRIMLEKNIRSPNLHRLWIIQLFEADFDFLLAVVFSHRLMGFARRHFTLMDQNMVVWMENRFNQLCSILTINFVWLKRTLPQQNLTPWQIMIKFSQC